ncbi:MAG: tetratricopeptide repeat protein [Archangium sp.]|nr:tetratricopeptide repeat protein [Archangium sp.]
MRWLRLVVLLSAITVHGAPEVLPPTVETMTELRKIEAAGYHQGQLDTFRLKYQDLARAKPGDAMPRVFVAWCTLPSDDAWNQLKAVATIFPDNPWVRYGMGRIYTTWKSMSDLARTEFDAILKRDPNFYPALVGLGDVARNKKDWPLAEEKYRAALKLNGEDPFAHAGLGLTLAEQGKKEEALAELKKAIATQPEQPNAVVTLVKLSTELKDPDTLKAAEALNELRPKDREARKLLADLRFDAQDKPGAAKEYERLVRLGNPTLDVLKRLATLDKELNDAEGEERTLQIIAALDDKDPTSNLRIAELRFARKDFEGAEGQWLEALARDPKLVVPHEGIAKSKLEQQKPHEALEELRQVLALDATRTESATLAAKLEADFKLPARKPRGKLDNVYWNVQASLAKYFDLKKAAKPALEGKYRIRVRLGADSKVKGVDVLEDTVKDPDLLGHVYFGLRDAEYVGQKGEPVFEFVLGKKK